MSIMPPYITLNPCKKELDFMEYVDTELDKLQKQINSTIVIFYTFIFFLYFIVWRENLIDKFFDDGYDLYKNLTQL